MNDLPPDPGPHPAPLPPSREDLVREIAALKEEIKLKHLPTASELASAVKSITVLEAELRELKKAKKEPKPADPPKDPPDEAAHPDDEFHLFPWMKGE